MSGSTSSSLRSLNTKSFARSRENMNCRSGFAAHKTMKAVFARQETRDIAERYGEHAHSGRTATWSQVSLTSPVCSLTAPRVSTAKPAQADVRTSIQPTRTHRDYT